MDSIIEVVVGKVTLATGNVIAISPDGEQRALKVGDAVHRDEIIQAGSNGAVAIQLTNRHSLELSNNQEVLLSLNAVAQFVEASSEDLDIERIQQALADGVDPDLVLPASQAGEETDLTAEELEKLPATEAGETVTEETADNIGFDRQPIVELSGMLAQPEAGFETTPATSDISFSTPFISRDNVTRFLGDGEPGDANDDNTDARVWITDSTTE
ncbi:retention module-containing protein, partial [Parendozoicomonas sp. Alg238-R29]|uniref:retention module-containing protein n=1 Tax=Parendozoicomonas sp. Alg238-R29 TaxID=2993446 RepID=UPI00248F23E2